MEDPKAAEDAGAASGAGSSINTTGLQIVDLKASGEFAGLSPIVPGGPKQEYFAPPRVLCVRFLGVTDNEHIKVCGPRDAQVVASASVSGSTVRLSVIADMDDIVTLQIGSDADEVNLTLEIEEETVGTATLPLKGDFISTRAAFPVDGASELNIVPPKEGVKTAGKFLIHAHWEDDDHVLREVGPMNYRVVEKRGIRLMRSPWLQSQKTREKLKVGEMVLACERLTDSEGNVWVKLSKADDQPAGREGWMIEADGDKKWLERLTRKWTKAAAAHLIQTRARGIMGRERFAEVKAAADAAAAEARAAEEEAQELERKRHEAAFMVQKMFAGNWSKNYVAERMNKVMAIQAWGRMVLDRWWYHRMVASIVALQKFARCINGRALYLRVCRTIVRFQGRMLGIRYRYPKCYFNVGLKRFYWGPVRRGFYVQKTAATIISNLFKTCFAWSLYLRKQEAIITIQTLMARPFFARVKLCSELTAQVEPRIVLLKQMQRANKAKITIWRRLVKRLAHPSALGVRGSTRVVVIAGGTTSGIAKKIAENFVSDDSKVWIRTVVVFAGQQEPPMKKLARLKERSSYVGVGSVVFKKADLLDEASVDELYRGIVAEYRKIDVLINNVSVDMADEFDFNAAPRSTSGTTVAGLSGLARGVVKNNPDRLVDADRLQKPFVCIKAAVPFLQQSKGVIVNICPPESLAASQASSHLKPGLLALTEFIGRAYPGIKCNAIRPIVTPYAKDGRQDIGKAISKMTGFLVDENAPCMSGQDFGVQGFPPEDAPLPKKLRDIAKQRLFDSLKIEDRYTFAALSTVMEPSEI
jgi:NAD(P)-dependent dehydrogenase (short-subunit alcohol dehydrogenase family)